MEGYICTHIPNNIRGYPACCPYSLLLTALLIKEKDSSLRKIRNDQGLAVIDAAAVQVIEGSDFPDHGAHAAEFAAVILPGDVPQGLIQSYGHLCIVFSLLRMCLRRTKA